MAPSKGDPRYTNDSPSDTDAYDLGKEMMNRARCKLGDLSPGGTEDRNFRSFFGAGVQVILAVWYLLQAHSLVPDGGMFVHYLWALMFMKIYSTEACMCGHAGGVTPKIFRKWIWPFIHAIADLENIVIRFENRKKGDKGCDALLSIDGTDYRTRWINNNFYSYKFKKAGLRYEIGLCILTGDICWLNGPYAPGMWNDGMIFGDALVYELEEGERVEADNGYLGHAPEYVRCPACIANDNDPEREAMQQRVRSRHETVNRRFKQWKILREEYRHKFAYHDSVFRAIAVLTQVSIEHGEPLFEVEYE